MAFFSEVVFLYALRVKRLQLCPFNYWKVCVVMYLDAFYQLNQEGTEVTCSFSPEQASEFAKSVAGDFNPLHDADNKRFCVPGDLLFAMTLAHQGLSQTMRFRYTGMVSNKQQLKFHQAPQAEFDLCDTDGKVYLNVAREGETIQDLALIEAFTRAYVAFSGESFPHILVPLMRENQVMINPARPMVIYESMSFDLQTFAWIGEDLRLELHDSQLTQEGKRGTVLLSFDVIANGEVCGTGQKTMLLSGLKPYDETQVQALVDLYLQSRDNYQVA